MDPGQSSGPVLVPDTDSRLGLGSTDLEPGQQAWAPFQSGVSPQAESSAVATETTTSLICEVGVSSSWQQVEVEIDARELGGAGVVSFPPATAVSVASPEVDIS